MHLNHFLKVTLSFSEGSIIIYVIYMVQVEFGKVQVVVQVVLDAALPILLLIKLNFLVKKCEIMAP